MKAQASEHWTSEEKRHKEENVWLSAVVDGSESYPSRQRRTFCEKVYLVSFIDLSDSMSWMLLFFCSVSFTRSVVLHSSTAVRKNQLRRLSKTKQPWKESTLFGWKKRRRRRIFVTFVNCEKTTNKHTNDTGNWMYVKKKPTTVWFVCVVAVNEINWCFRDDDGLFFVSRKF